MAVLAQGVWPARGPLGEDFRTVGGYRSERVGQHSVHNLAGIFCQVIADWKWQSTMFGFEQRWNTTFICRDCMASRDSFSDFRFDAPDVVARRSTQHGVQVSRIAGGYSSLYT